MGLFSGLKKAFKGLGKVASSPLGQIGLSLIPGGGIVSGLARAGIGALAAKGQSPVALPGGAMMAGFNGGSMGPSFPGFENFLKNSYPIPSSSPIAQKYLTGFTGSGASGGYGPVTGSQAGYHLDKRTRSHWVKNRHTNFMNLRAARKAIGRVKGARRILKSIESALPKRAASHSSPFRRRRR